MINKNELITVTNVPLLLNATGELCISSNDVWWWYCMTWLIWC